MLISKPIKTNVTSKKKLKIKENVDKSTIINHL